MADIIVGLVIITIIGLSITKIVIEKRKGVKCIGCPHSGITKKSDCSCETVNFD